MFGFRVISPKKTKVTGSPDATHCFNSIITEVYFADKEKYIFSKDNNLIQRSKKFKRVRGKCSNFLFNLLLHSLLNLKGTVTPESISVTEFNKTHKGKIH